VSSIRRADLRATGSAGPAKSLQERRGFFSKNRIEALVLSGAWRELQLFAGRSCASNVASRGGTPPRNAGIQARITTGSLCSVGGGDHSIKHYRLLNVDPVIVIRAGSTTGTARHFGAATGASSDPSTPNAFPAFASGEAEQAHSRPSGMRLSRAATDTSQPGQIGPRWHAPRAAASEQRLTGLLATS